MNIQLHPRLPIGGGGGWVSNPIRGAQISNILFKIIPRKCMKLKKNTLGVGLGGRGWRGGDTFLASAHFDLSKVWSSVDNGQPI